MSILAYEINHLITWMVNTFETSSTIKEVANEDAQEILENLNIVPVLTAHPTQVQRKPYWILTNHIHALPSSASCMLKAGLMNENKWYNNLVVISKS